MLLNICSCPTAIAGLLRCHVQKLRRPQQCGNVKLLPALAAAILVGCLHPGRNLRTRYALGKVSYVAQSKNGIHEQRGVNGVTLPHEQQAVTRSWLAGLAPAKAARSVTV